MALTNYTTLQTAVAAWLNRSDLTSELPDFIQQAEEEFNNTLRVPQMESRVNFTITGEYVTAPNDFLEFRTGYLDSSPRRELAYLSPDIQTASHAGAPTGSGPVYFSLVAGSFRFDPAPTVPVDAVLVYYAKIPPLSLQATNWLLLRAPTLYLYEACFQGSVRIQDDDRAMRARQLCESVRAKFVNSSNRSRWGGPGMAARPG